MTKKTEKTNEIKKPEDCRIYVIANVFGRSADGYDGQVLKSWADHLKTDDWAKVHIFIEALESEAQSATADAIGIRDALTTADNSAFTVGFLPESSTPILAFKYCRHIIDAVHAEDADGFLLFLDFPTFVVELPKFKGHPGCAYAPLAVTESLTVNHYIMKPDGRRCEPSIKGDSADYSTNALFLPIEQAVKISDAQTKDFPTAFIAKTLISGSLAGTASAYLKAFCPETEILKSGLCYMPDKNEFSMENYKKYKNRWYQVAGKKLYQKYCEANLASKR